METYMRGAQGLSAASHVEKVTAFSALCQFSTPPAPCLSPSKTHSLREGISASILFPDVWVSAWPIEGSQ